MLCLGYVVPRRRLRSAPGSPAYAPVYCERFRTESRLPIKGVKPYRIRVDDLELDVYRKRIKHLYLRVDASDGRVRISAPYHLNEASVREVVARRMSWIRRQQEKQRRRGPEREELLVTGERHYVEGMRVSLEVTTFDGPPLVYLLGQSILAMRVPPDAGLPDRQTLLARWYRQRLKRRVPAMIAVWEPVLKVTVTEWRIRKMRTRWGTCNFRAHRIWLSLELAKKPARCLEYVIVHEMAHLIEPSHSRRFWGILDRVMPDWQARRDELNRFPDAEQDVATDQGITA